jgi:hypothetical protein
MKNNKFSKLGHISIITVLLITLFGFISVVPIMAKNQEIKEEKTERREFCFCHNLNSNPQTVCVTNFGDYFGHLIHVFQRKDSFGRCGVVSPTEPPSVPEFGLVTGVVTLLSSGGIAYVFRKRQ